MDEAPAIRVEGNWKVELDKDLSKAVTVNRSPKAIDSESDLDSVSVETCVHLSSPPETSDTCHVNLSCCLHGDGLGHIIVVSEARHLEVFSSKGEYMSTIQGQFVDKVDDDFVVYKVKIEFQKPVTSCIIKFLSLRNPKEMWIYGINVTIRKFIPPPPPPAAGLDISAILERLGQDPRQPLSEKAQRFMQFLSTYQSVPGNASGDRHRRTKQDESLEDMASTPAATPATVPTPTSIPNGISPVLLQTLKNSVLREVKCIIEGAVGQMEDSLGRRMEDRMAEMESRQVEKLNRILELLESTQAGRECECDCKNNNNRANLNELSDPLPEIVIPKLELS